MHCVKKMLDMEKIKEHIYVQVYEQLFLHLKNKRPANRSEQKWLKKPLS